MILFFLFNRGGQSCRQTRFDVGKRHWTKYNAGFMVLLPYREVGGCFGLVLRHGGGRNMIDRSDSSRRMRGRRRRRRNVFGEVLCHVSLDPLVGCLAGHSEERTQRYAYLVMHMASTAVVPRYELQNARQVLLSPRLAKSYHIATYGTASSFRVASIDGSIFF